MTTRIPGLLLALLFSQGICKRRDEATAPPTPTPVVTTVPAPVQPGVVDAGPALPTVPAPNAMAQPGTVPDAGGLAPGAVAPTGAPPAPPIAAAPTAPTAPAAPTAPPAPHAPTTAHHPTQIQIPGLANQPPINIDQSNGQTRVNVGGVQVLIPGVTQGQ